MLKCERKFTTVANLCLGKYAVLPEIAVIAIVYGSLVLYMILFAHIAISIVEPYVEVPDSEEKHLMETKWFYVVFLGIVTLPFIVKKRMQELNCMTYVMFTGVISLIALLTIKLRVDGSYTTRFPDDSDATETPSLTFEHLIDCINIGIASHGFVITFFPIYIDMTEEACPKVLVSVFWALMFCFSIYMSLGLVSLNYYGSQNI